MITFKEFLAQKGDSATQEELPAEQVVVTFVNRPFLSNEQLLFESAVVSLEEGKTKDWGRGYRYRLDRRPENQGGDQLHIYGPKGKAWAYRHSGARSEPGKYTLPTTNLIKDIVSDVFGIDKVSIEEIHIASVSEGEIILEVSFA